MIMQKKKNRYCLLQILVSMFLLIPSINVWAVKAYPLAVEVKQADGTTLMVVLHGDEDFHYCMTTDGILLVREGDSFFIAEQSGDLLMSSGVLAHESALRTTAERSAIARQDIAGFLQSSASIARKSRQRREPVVDTGNLFPHEGSPRAVVILAEFCDHPFSLVNPKRSFEQYFMKEGNLNDFGNRENSNVSSVRDYFSNVSFGKFTPQFDVYGPVTLPDSLKVYGGSEAGGKGENMSKLFTDACTLMDDSLDFSQYDGNDDGKVDLVIIIYAGYSQSITGNSNECIWPKSGTLSAGSYDGKRVARYAVNAELIGFPNCYSSAPYKRINGIGTMCHEFCHTLGLPDFYPTNSSVKGDNQGMEYWSLMDSGNYLSNGCSPVSLNAWEREALGWITVEDLTETGDVTLKSIDDGGTAYRIYNDEDASRHEYFLIENIQNIGHNAAQKGHGMLVYHVDYDETKFSLNNNRVNNEKGHPRMTVVPADGWLFASYNVGKKINGIEIKNKDFYDELTGDPFPGTSNRKVLNDTLGIVNFQVYHGERLNKALENIEESDDGVINMRFISDFASGIQPLFEADRQRDYWYYSIDGRKAGRDIRSLEHGIYIINGRKVVAK